MEELQFFLNTMLLQQRMFQVAGLQNAEGEAEGRSV